MHPSEPSLCPECGKPEDIKQVCRHCGHEYRDEDSSGWCVPLVILGMIAVVWLSFTLGFWLLEQDFDKPTLLDVLNAQGAFFRGLRIW